MYWRDYYSTVDQAVQAERLGDLGKVKLSAQQKAAIAAAKADAKVAKVQAKQNIVAQKLAAKALAVAKKGELKAAKYDAKIAIQRGKAADAAPVAETPALPALLPAPVDTGFAAQIPQSFSQGGGGGGGGAAMPYEAAPAAVASDDPFGIPMPVLIGGGILVAILLFKGKR